MSIYDKVSVYPFAKEWHGCHSTRGGIYGNYKIAWAKIVVALTIS
jgi:hypothetical protein